MAYIYLVTKKDGAPIAGFTRKYMLKNFLSYNKNKGLDNSNSDYYTMCEGGRDTPKKVNKEFFTEAK